MLRKFNLLPTLSLSIYWVKFVSNKQYVMWRKLMITKLDLKVSLNYLQVLLSPTNKEWILNGKACALNNAYTLRDILC